MSLFLCFYFYMCLLCFICLLIFFLSLGVLSFSLFVLLFYVCLKIRFNWRHFYAIISPPPQWARFMNFVQFQMAGLIWKEANYIFFQFSSWLTPHRVKFLKKWHKFTWHTQETKILQCRWNHEINKGSFLDLFFV